MSPRRQSGPTLTVFRWQQIPAHISARHGEELVQASLPARFHVAIDRATMGGGAAGTDEYERHWHKDQRSCSADLRAEVEAEVAALDGAVSDADLERFVRGAREARRARMETP